MKPEQMARMAIAVCRSAGDVLGELHAMLEQYGPSWYTERLNERAESALQLINGL
jgi:Ser/Thr protein kinase RdoA (MazF antagonist)